MKSSCIPHVVGAGLLTFGLACSPLTLPASAQNNSAPATMNTTPGQNVNSAPLNLNHTNFKNDQGSMRQGWLGLSGLIGLVGLAGRKRQNLVGEHEGNGVPSSIARR